MKDPLDSDYTIGVVGAGAMGQGIAQVAVQGGLRTIIFDARDGGAAAGRDAIAGRLNRLAEKGRMSAEDVAAATALLEVAPDLAALAPCDAVVEAVFEDLDVKRGLFEELEGHVSDDCLIASNTSSIPIAALAAGRNGRERYAGLHFFNPVPLMKLVEVIRGADTSDAATDALAKIGERMGRTPVVVKDAPGFLVNLGGRAYTTEALHIVHEGIATPEQVDAVMRDCWGFRMGPFELMDLTGIDVNYPVSQIVYDGYMQDPRLKTSPLHKAMYDSGNFGRKTGRGWFAYENGQPLPRPSPDFEPSAAPARAVAIAGVRSYMFDAVEADADAEDDDLFEGDDFIQPPYEDQADTEEMAAVRAFCEEIGLKVIDDDGFCPLVAAPIGWDATGTALNIMEPDASVRLVCIDLMGDVSKRVPVMAAPGADRRIFDSVAAAIAASGRKVTAIKDSPGFVGQRMCAMVANLGCFMAEIGLATPADVDTAMKLGLNYPFGPLELAEKMGLENCESVLDSLNNLHEGGRYRVTPWIRRRSQLGLPVRTPS